MALDGGFELIQRQVGENIRVFYLQDIAQVFEKLSWEEGVSFESLFLVRPDMPPLSIEGRQEIVESRDHHLGEDRPRLRAPCGDETHTPLALQHKVQNSEFRERFSPFVAPCGYTSWASRYDRHTFLPGFLVNGDNLNVWMNVPRFVVYVGLQEHTRQVPCPQFWKAGLNQSIPRKQFPLAQGLFHFFSLFCLENEIMGQQLPPPLCLSQDLRCRVGTKVTFEV